MDTDLPRNYNEKIKRRRCMTTLLAKAFEEATQLPDTEQNALARWLLEGLESDRKWSEAFAESEERFG